MNNVISFIGNSSNKYFQINQLHFIRIINKNIHSKNNLINSNSSYNIFYNKYFIKNTFQNKNKLSSIYSKLNFSIKNMCKDKNEKKNYEHVNANEKNGYLASEKNELTKNKVEEHTYDYDYVVIGGGPGGMASAKEAAAHGARVLLFDYVKPSSQGTKWGIGGTCVNVGCVPKKLMHYAGHMGSIFKLDSKAYGWKFDNLKHDWKKLVTTVQSHIRSLNFSYMTGLRSSKVKYINGLAKLKDKNTVSYYLKGDLSKEETVTGKYILIATGCRPHIPDDVEGAKELSITSDDIFSLKKDPGKTLVVGASYVALECSGFLNSLGYDVTVAVRSIVLRGFDQQCAVKVKLYMEEQGVMFKNENLYLKNIIGVNEKTKLIVKVQPKKFGAPVREARVDHETYKAMLAYYYKKQKEEKEFEEDDDDSYLNSEWANPLSLQKQLHGNLNNIKWKP